MSAIKISKIARNICFLLSLFLAGVFVWASAYATYGGDDFCFAMEFGLYHENVFRYFLDAFTMVGQKYINWQGTYFSCFLLYILNPLVGFGYIQLRVISILNTVLIFISIFLFLKELCIFLNIKKGMALIFFSFIMIPLLSFKAYKDIFYFFTCYVVYSIPMAILLFGMVFLMRGLIKSKTKYFILSSICMLLMAGGTLEVACLGCYLVLLVLLGKYLSKKKIDKHGLFVLGAGLIGTLINAAAPGNFARRVNYDGGSSMLQSLLRAAVDTIKAVWIEIDWLIMQTPFFVVILISLLAGILIGYQLGKAWKIVAIGSILLPFATIFPVVLGYATADNLPDRCLFIFDLVIISLFVFLSFILGGILKNTLKIIADGKFVVLYVILILIAGFATRNNYSLLSNNVWATLKGVVSGEVQQGYHQMIGIYSDIETSSDKVIIIENYPENKDYINFNYFSVVPEDWVNNAIAMFYGKEQIYLLEKSGE